jgi:hypothetical protein
VAVKVTLVPRVTLVAEDVSLVVVAGRATTLKEAVAPVSPTLVADAVYVPKAFSITPLKLKLATPFELLALTVWLKFPGPVMERVMGTGAPPTTAPPASST